MALTKCSECGQLISDKSIKCPKCGCPTSESIKTLEVQEIKKPKNGVNEKNYKEGKTAKIILPDKKKKNRLFWLIIPVILLILIGSIGGLYYYNNIYLPEKIDRDSPRYFTISNGTNLRSSKITNPDDNILITLPYGTQVIVYEQNTEWSTVKVDNQEGYIASHLLVDKKDYCILNSIFGNESSKDCIFTTKCRKALLNYYKERKLIGNISEELLNEILPNLIKTSDNQWQIFCRPKEIKPNSVFYLKLSGKTSLYTDFAVIIQNIISEERKILIFTFDDNENPTLIYENIAPDKGYIKNIKQLKYHNDNMVLVDYQE